MSSLTISVRLSPSQREALETAAQRAGCSPSQLLRTALAQAVAAQGLPWPDDLSAPGERLAALAAGAPFIDVANMQARVARWRGLGAGAGWKTVLASNWEALEADAAQAVKQAGGLLGMGHYACPPELAARAEWDAQEG